MKRQGCIVLPYALLACQCLVFACEKKIPEPEPSAWTAAAGDREPTKSTSPKEPPAGGSVLQKASTPPKVDELIREDVKEGTGAAAKSGDRVIVHYGQAPRWHKVPIAQSNAAIPSTLS